LRAPCQLASGSLPRGSGLDLDSDFVRRFGDLVALKGVVKYPIRIKCAVLAWDVLQEALQDAGEATGAQPHTAG